jgi:hypothetical protein
MLLHIKGGLEDELTVECYEADLDRWTPGPGLPGGNRSQHAAVRVQDRLYVSGGLDHDTVLSSLLGMALAHFSDFEKTTFERRLCFAEFNPASCTWEVLAEMPVPRADHAMLAFQVGTKPCFCFANSFV